MFGRLKRYALPAIMFAGINVRWGALSVTSNNVALTGNFEELAGVSDRTPGNVSLFSGLRYASPEQAGGSLGNPPLRVTNASGLKITVDSYWRRFLRAHDQGIHRALLILRPLLVL